MGCKVIVLTEESISTQLQSLVDKNIQVIEEVRVEKISGLERVESVLIEHFNGEEETIHTKTVFIFGTISPATLIAQAGITESKLGCISINHSCKTNIEGVYAAGDITCSGFQAVIAADQGARAAMQVIKYIRRLKRNS